MTEPTSVDLIRAAGLDTDRVTTIAADALSGADDGELFFEYSQSEALMFDNGRLKSAS